jgi:hypothetical protein
MNIVEAVDQVRDREQLIAFIRMLACGLREQPHTWENRDLPSYLDAMAAWIEDMDGYFLSKGEQPADQPSWRLLSEILMAARSYE